VTSDRSVVRKPPQIKDPANAPMKPFQYWLYSVCVACLSKRIRIVISHGCQDAEPPEGYVRWLLWYW